MSRTIKALTGVKKHVEINKIELENADIKVTPTEEKSNFAKKLFNNEKVVSIEITPYEKNKRILLINLQLKLYAQKDAWVETQAPEAPAAEPAANPDNPSGIPSPQPVTPGGVSPEATQ